MPLKYYGIFLAYGPTVDLRKEGLGRLLAAFLIAAATRDDVRFVIVLPGWLRSNFIAFCESEGISQVAFDLVTTDGAPFMLHIYLAYLDRKRRPPSKSRFMQFRKFIERKSIESRRRFSRGFVAARNALPWFLTAAYAIGLFLVFFPLFALLWLAAKVLGYARRLSKRLLAAAGSAASRILGVLHDATEESLEVRLYRLMEDLETKRMVDRINTLHHVKAWYSPTAFWPEFNRIAAPGLLCVPDVLPTEFPVGFASEPELLGNVERVERTIRGANAFVTYSSRVKWLTLVDRYSVRPQDVAVIPHSFWDLSPWIHVRGFSDEDRATRTYCESMLQVALNRSGFGGSRPPSDSVRFIFYASQFRPNKNLFFLIEAYEDLLRDQLVHHKLILTGDPNRNRPVLEFVQARGLGADVIFLHGLTTRELAACYHLADLAINPSLSEGGFPFTFSEALSVNTPVVMARIGVTEEVLGDPKLQEISLFDPYDHKDAAAKIGWALKNREALLSAQREAFAKMHRRTWRTVVDEYLAILEGLEDHKRPIQGKSL